MKRIATVILLWATCVIAGSSASWVHVAGGAWDPDDSVLKDLSGGIENYVVAGAARQDAKLSAWDKYRFQYQGWLKGKKRIVFVNAFCRSGGDERLESELLFVFDGGPCFFTLEYDAETGEFHSLRFNGYG